MTAKKPTKKTAKKTAPKKKAAAKKPATKKAAPKSTPSQFAKTEEVLPETAKPVAETPKLGTVIYAADVKNRSIKQKFFAWFRR